MPSRRPAGPCCPALGYRSGVSLRETGQPVSRLGELRESSELRIGELRESSELRRSSRFRKSSELKVQRETSEVEKAGQHQQIRFSSFGEKKRIQLCQRAKDVNRVTKLEMYNDERRMEEEEQVYATVRRVKGEGEGFRPYQAPRQAWGYQVKEKTVFLYGRHTI